MPDFDAIGTALALRFAPAQVTAPSGYNAIRLSTADIPNEMAPLPAVFVIPVDGTFETGNGTRTGSHDWVVRFYYSQTADLPRDMPALRKWLTVLVDQLRAAAQLGGIVVRATVDRWTAGLMDFAGQSYSGIELRVGIVTSEPWAATA